MSEITEQNQDRLIIVIPAYNEEENIENVVAQWHPIVEKTGGDSRLFVINDGSTDRTQEELDHLQGKYPQLRTVKKENQGTRCHYFIWLPLCDCGRGRLYFSDRF